MSLKIEDMPPGFAEELKAELKKSMDARAIERPNVVAVIESLRDENERLKKLLHWKPDQSVFIAIHVDDGVSIKFEDPNIDTVYAPTLSAAIKAAMAAKGGE